MPIVLNGATELYRRNYLRHKSKHHISVSGSITLQPIVGTTVANPQSLTLTNEDYLYEKLGVSGFDITASGGNAEYSIISE